MKYAVIKLSGKQYKVSVGDTFSVDRLDIEPGKKMNISDVLMVVDGEKVEIGTPLLNQVVVIEALEQKKDKKIRVATYKAKSRSRKVKGHRQHKTVVKVISIGKETKAPAKKVAPKSTPKK
jgi:large subunit ribosomal protein L21